VAFEAQNLIHWDSSILTFLTDLSEICRQRSINLDRAGLPVGVRRLLDLAEVVPERKGARKESEEASLLERIGATKARYRAPDLFLLIQQCGAEALPIVPLISFLVGVILAFVGAVRSSPGTCSPSAGREAFQNETAPEKRRASRW